MLRKSYCITAHPGGRTICHMSPQHQRLLEYWFGEYVPVNSHQSQLADLVQRHCGIF